MHELLPVNDAAQTIVAIAILISALGTAIAKVVIAVRYGHPRPRMLIGLGLCGLPDSHKARGTDKKLS
jgi:hypothetical protein